MIARPLPYEELQPSRSGTRAGRTAVRRRRARTRRERYTSLVRIFATAAVLVIVVTVYLALMANVTRMNYELAKLAQQHAALLDVTAVNDDAIADAESNERLRAYAKKLGMHEPQTFAAIAMPADPPKAAGGIAFLSWLK